MKKSNILVVDDAKDTRDLLQFALELEGFNVAAVPDGSVAQQFANEFKPDLMIVDLVMPEVSGAELIKQFRGQAQYTSTPIIVYSAHSDAALEEAKAAGATAVVSKLGDITDLPRTVSHLLSPSAMLSM